MNIGKVIRDLRVKKNLTQQQLAESSGITQTSLSQIESGVTRPSPKTLKLVGKQLGVPEVFIYLLSIEAKDVPLSKREAYDILFPSIEKLFSTDQLPGNGHS